MRSVPAALQAHLDSPTRTTCWLLKITLKDGRGYGMTTLDRDVEYLDTTYYAATGFDPSRIVTDSSTSVNNAQPTGFLSGGIPGITLSMAAGGELDDAKWSLLMVNYEDLSMGHVVIGAGDLGEVTIVNDSIYMPELLDITMRLRQPIGHFTSRTCRAVFGTPANSMTGCGVNVDTMWVSGEVTGVSVDEPKRVFADSSKPLNPFPNRVRLQWLSGDNAGSRMYQVEAYGSSTGTMSLVEPTPFDIYEGDEYRIRPDCDKTPDDCKTYGNWPNYKGENLIPSGDGGGLLTPGASVAGGLLGSVEE